MEILRGEYETNELFFSVLIETGQREVIRAK